VARGERGVILKTPEEIEAIRASGRIVAGALRAMEHVARPGVPTVVLDRVGEDFIRSHGAVPSFKDYRPLGAPKAFPAAVCIAVNDVVVHGIPSERVVLKEGDIVGLDVGAFLDGFHADAATTLEIGEVEEKVRLLVSTTRAALEAAIEVSRVGKRLSDISAAIQRVVEGGPRGPKTGMRCVRDLSGHGVGRNLHEPPSVLNYVHRGAEDMALEEGMTLAVEPMTSLGAAYTRLCPLDQWGARTADGSWSAHFEHTIAVIGRDRARVLTALDD
jgi:methionyl aminopeptidase